MIYIFLALFLYVSTLSKSTKLYTVNLVLVFIYFSSAYCFNYDWINYRNFYENVLSDNLVQSIIESGFEPGFVIIAYSTKLLGLDYQWVIVFLNVIVFSFFNSSIKKFHNKNIALFIFFSFFGFFLLAEQIRQAVALAIGLKAIQYYIDKKASKFYFLTILAILFHVSAVFLFVIMYVHKIFSRKSKPVIILIMLIAGTLAPLLFSIILQNPSFFSFYPLLAKKLAYYSNQDLGNDSGILTPGLLPNIILLLLVCYYCLKTFGSRHSQQALVASAFIIQSKIISLFYRFSHYGIIYFFFCFDEIFKDKKPLNLFRFFVMTIILSFGLKPLSTELYRASVLDYQFYWTTSQDQNSMKDRKCDILYQVYPTSTYTIGTCS